MADEDMQIKDEQLDIEDGGDEVCGKRELKCLQEPHALGF